MTKPRKQSAPASKREHLGADVMTYFRQRAARDPEFAAASREEAEKLRLAHRMRELREAKDPGATQPADKTAPPERPSSWSPEDILAIAKTLRVR